MGLYGNNAFQQLKFYLEGKTIALIEKTNAPEAICKFVMTDGSAFRLHATDLGFWMEDTAGNRGYNSLNALIVDYARHLHSMLSYFKWNPPPATIDISGDVVIMTAPEGETFVGNISKFNEIERQIINHPKGREIIAKNACLGDLWVTYFNKKYTPDCPEELLFDPTVIRKENESNG